MTHIKEQTARVVASDTQSMLTAIDNALLQQVRLCASVIEATGETELPVITTQKLYSSLSNGISRIVEGRAEAATSIRHLQAIQSRSNLRETSFGCPGGPVTLMSIELVPDSALG